MIKYRILHYVPNFKYGGIESNIMSLLKSLDDDIIFDFLVENEDVPKGFKELVQEKNGKIIKISSFRKRPLKHIIELKNLFKKNKYNIVEVHSFSTRPLVLKIAKKYGVEHRIMHIHSASRNNDKYKIIKYLNEKITIKNANHFIACSKKAGNRYLKNTKFYILSNGIEIDDYKYNEQIRIKYRRKLNIESKKVYGHVGRFTYLKNHKYLIEIFKEILKQEKNSVLLLIGSGEKKSNILRYINEIKNDVIILEDREDVGKILSAMDVFIFPSISEGFGMALLEAQANGIPCYVSNKIPKEVIIEENIKTIDICESPIKVAQIILKSDDARIKIGNELDEFSDKNISKKYFEYIKNM